MTLYDRNRSKELELLSRVHDHNTNRFVCGFSMLTFGWSDVNKSVATDYVGET